MNSVSPILAHIFLSFHYFGCHLYQSIIRRQFKGTISLKGEKKVRGEKKKKKKTRPGEGALLGIRSLSVFIICSHYHVMS